MAERPELLAIGPYRVEVHQTPPKWNTLDEESGVMGLFRTSEYAIYLKPGMSPQVTADTLWHEVKHALVRLTSGSEAEHQTYSEEEWVAKTTTLEIMVLRDNRKLVNYLLEPE
jgi:hypothetical protein